MESPHEFPRVRPAIRSGGWEVEGVGYRTQAQLCLRRLQEKRKTVREKLDRLEAARKKGRTYRIPPELLEEYRFFGSAAVVYAAMAVEGFLNYYGVKRLGEDFYRENFERLSAHRKLAAVVASCTGHLLPDKAELVAIIRRLAERRNALVHPKARELKPKRQRRNAPTAPPEPAEDSVRDMERFFELFTQLDPEAVGAITY